jgi:hypothetical protein
MASDPSPSSGDQPGTDSPEYGLTRSFGWSDMFVRPEGDGSGAVLRCYE